MVLRIETLYEITKKVVRKIEMERQVNEKEKEKQPGYLSSFIFGKKKDDYQLSNDEK